MTGQVLLINPRRRKKRRTKARRKSRRVKSNPIFTKRRRRRKSARRATFGRVRRFRRNPIGGGLVREVTNLAGPVVAGAGGALVADVVLGILPVPDTLKGPTVRPFVRAGVAIAVGILTGMALGKDVGKKVMLGGLTVVGYDVGKGFVQTTFPTVQLGCAEDMPALPFLDDGASDTPVMLSNDLSDDDGMGLVFNAGMGEAFDPSFY